MYFSKVLSWLRCEPAIYFARHNGSTTRLLRLPSPGPIKLSFGILISWCSQERGRESLIKKNLAFILVYFVNCKFYVVWSNQANNFKKTLTWPSFRPWSGSDLRFFWPALKLGPHLDQGFQSFEDLHQLKLWTFLTRKKLNYFFIKWDLLM